jgi:hypothetical protein
MAATQSDIDALKEAIRTGAKKVRYESGGEVREVTYRTLEEMRSILADMEAEFAGTPRSRSMLASYNRRV